jgi:hypothetical protein
MRRGAVPSLAGEANVEFVREGGHSAAVRENLAVRQIRHPMNAQHLFYIVFFPHARFDQISGAALAVPPYNGE